MNQKDSILILKEIEIRCPRVLPTMPRAPMELLIRSVKFAMELATMRIMTRKLYAQNVKFAREQDFSPNTWIVGAVVEGEFASANRSSWLRRNATATNLHVSEVYCQIEKCLGRASRDQETRQQAP